MPEKIIDRAIEAHTPSSWYGPGARPQAVPQVLPLAPERTGLGVNHLLLLKPTIGQFEQIIIPGQIEKSLDAIEVTW